MDKRNPRSYAFPISLCGFRGKGEIRGGLEQYKPKFEYKIWWLLRDTTILVAEARAIRESLSYCSEHGITNLIIETNSLAMVHIIEVDWDVPLNVALEVIFFINYFKDTQIEGIKLLNLDKQGMSYIRRNTKE
uniref:RNase H type-1 domain-containing protein n=1 Tax=Solanum lycopersicum TaxID=4081 RepID=A0A3Q7GUW5_SOLLC